MRPLRHARAFSLMEVIGVLVLLSIISSGLGVGYVAVMRRISNNDAEHSVNLAATTQQLRYKSRNAYTANPTTLETLEGSLTWTNDWSTDAKTVSVALVDPDDDTAVQSVGLAAYAGRDCAVAVISAAQPDTVLTGSFTPDDEQDCTGSIAFTYAS